MVAARGRGRTADAAGGGAGIAAEKLAHYLEPGGESTRGSADQGGVLVDTCAWIDYLRSGETALGNALDGFLRAGRVFTCGQVLMELLQGVRSERERSMVMAALGALEYVELGARSWLRAAGMAVELRRTGRRLPQSDVLIAALAMEHDLAVLTEDAHFEGIPGLRLV